MLPVGLHFDNPNCGIGRREISFERVRLTWASNGVLALEGVVQFAPDHAQACEIARQHERDFRAMVAAEETLPVWHNDFPEIDGSYIVSDVVLPTASPYDFHLLRLELIRIGSSNDLTFESVVLGTVKENDFSVDVAGSEPILAPPIGHTNYTPPSSYASTVTRNVAYEGDITVYRDIDYDVDPKWAVSARDANRGAATISRRTPLFPQYGPISGTSLFSAQLEDIEIQNGITRFWIDGITPWVSFWDGTAWRDQSVFFVGEASAAVSIWQHVTILDNRPERCSLVYEGSAGGSVKLYVSLRRGERGVSCVLTADSATRLGVFGSPLSAVTITSNRALKTAADANGHKLLFVSMRNFSNVSGDGYIYVDAATRFDVLVSAELASSAAGNTAATIGAQAASAVRETVRALPR